MIHKTQQVRRNYLYIAIILFIIAVGIIGVVTIKAEKAPDAPTPHCELLTNDDTCYILVQPGRSITMEQNGDAWVFTLTELPIGGE
jgi:hypothetical protein